jgi:TrpR-related protein YerC/YecD
MNSSNWKTPDTAKLFEAVLALKTPVECEAFFRDLLTLAEIREFANRFRVARMLEKGNKPYLAIAKEARTTTATVTRVAQWLKSGMGGYRLIINRLNHHHNRSAGGVG